MMAMRALQTHTRCHQRLGFPHMPARCPQPRAPIGPRSTMHRRRVLMPINVFDNLKQWLGGKEKEPQPEEEMGTMRRLDPEETRGVDGAEEAFGPATVLLVGFSEEEVKGFNALMQELGADSLFKVTPCKKAMMSGTLQAALEAGCTDYEQPALGTRRAIVLSGMFGGEVIEIVEAYRSSGLPPAVFAAAVPNNMSRNLADLLQEVAAEDAAMRRMQAMGEASEE